jgi:hypothetical protein
VHGAHRGGRPEKLALTAQVREEIARIEAEAGAAVAA